MNNSTIYSIAKAVLSFHYDSFVLIIHNITSACKEQLKKEEIRRMSRRISQHLKRIGALIVVLSIIISIVPAEIAFAEENSLSVKANGTDWDSAEVYVLPGEGTTLTVQVTADDMTDITYRWYQIDINTNNWSEVENGDTDFLTLTDVTERCSFVCDVRDRFNNSATAWFNVYVDNALSVRPTDYEGNELIRVLPGQGTTLVTNVSANNYSGISFKWFGVDPETSEWLEIEGEDAEALRLDSVTKKCTYRCDVTDCYNNCISAWFYVEIENEFSVRANDSEWSNIDVYVSPGDGTTLTVQVTANDSSLIRYQWCRSDAVTGEYSEITGADTNTLVLTDITEACNYCCEVFDRYNNSRAGWFYVHIDNALSVTANETEVCDDTLYILPGGSTTLTVNVVANDYTGITYKWYKNDLDPWDYVEIPGMDPSDNEYTLSNVMKRCYLWCEVTDNYGNTANAHFYVNVQNNLDVRANDSLGCDDYVYAVPGDSTTLTVHVTADDYSGIEYEWYKTDPAIGEGVLIADENTDTLVLSEVTENADYCCTVYDCYGNSSGAYFHIRIDNSLSVKANDSEEDSVNVYVLPGAETTLTVNVTANDYTGITYRWNKYDPETDDYIVVNEAENNTLTLTSVEERCEYNCDVRDIYGNCATAWFYVYIDNALSVRANDNEGNGTNVYLLSGEGTTLTAHVTANDYTGITYKWYRIDQTSGEWLEISDEETDTLSLTGITELCQYTCEVRDMYDNTATAWFNVFIDNTLSVRANDSEYADAAISVEPGEGTTLTVHVTANDYTDITYKWYRIDQTTGEWFEIEDEETDTLTLSSVTDHCRYSCEVRDSYNNCVNAWFEIYINNALSVTANDNDWGSAEVYLGPGEGTTLTAHADATDMDGITYRWYRVDTDTWEEYEITTTDPEGNNLYLDCIFGYEMYRCRVKDKYGNEASAEFYVRLDNGLKVTANDNDWASADVYLAPGEGTTLTAHADATDMDGITYRWYRVDTDTWEEQEITTSDPEGNSLYLDCVLGYELYRCRVKDRYDNEVTAEFYVRLDNALTVTANDNDWASAEVNLLPGEGTTLTAHVSANDYDGITYRWYRINTETWEQVPVETTEPASNELYLSDVSGYVIYRCIVNDKYGNEACADFYVRMDNALTVTANDNDWASADIDVVPGGSASLVTNVSARDMSGITYKWYKIDPINWGETQLTDTGNTLELTDVMERWNYRCDVSDGYGNTNSAYFYVRVNNGLYVRTNSSTAVAYGGEITLYAYASAYEMRGITYTWYSIDSGWGETLITGTDPAVNHITVSGITERCNYKCIVLDKYNNEVVTYISITAWKVISAIPDTRMVMLK